MAAASTGPPRFCGRILDQFSLHRAREAGDFSCAAMQASVKSVKALGQTNRVGQRNGLARRVVDTFPDSLRPELEQLERPR